MAVEVGVVGVVVGRPWIKQQHSYSTYFPLDISSPGPYLEEILHRWPPGLVDRPVDIEDISSFSYELYIRQ